MLNFAFIFPGQGAQYVGMGRDLYLHNQDAKQIFEQADQLLGFKLTELMFNGPEETLTRTANCQPAVFVVSVAALTALKTICPRLKPSFTAGLSLGECTALVAAGVFSFEQGLKLVQKRARYMQQASEDHPGGMLSIMGLELEQVRAICAAANAEIANLNCPGQVVVSGSIPDLDQARQAAEAAGAKRAIALNVGGAFHSSLMSAAADKLKTALAELTPQTPRIPVISNVTAREQSDPQQIRDNLSRQVVSSIRWEDSMRLIASSGTKEFLEIGPGKILKGLMRKIDPQFRVHNIEKQDDIEQFRKEKVQCS